MIPLPGAMERNAAAVSRVGARTLSSTDASSSAGDCPPNPPNVVAPLQSREQREDLILMDREPLDEVGDVREIGDGDMETTGIRQRALGAWSHHHDESLTGRVQLPQRRANQLERVSGLRQICAIPPLIEFLERILQQGQ